MSAFDLSWKVTDHDPPSDLSDQAFSYPPPLSNRNYFSPEQHRNHEVPYGPCYGQHARPGAFVNYPNPNQSLGYAQPFPEVGHATTYVERPQVRVGRNLQRLRQPVSQPAPSSRAYPTRSQGGQYRSPRNNSASMYSPFLGSTEPEQYQHGSTGTSLARPQWNMHASLESQACRSTIDPRHGTPYQKVTPHAGGHYVGGQPLSAPSPGSSNHSFVYRRVDPTNEGVLDPIARPPDMRARNSRPINVVLPNAAQIQPWTDRSTERILRGNVSQGTCCHVSTLLHKSFEHGNRRQRSPLMNLTDGV